MMTTALTITMTLGLQILVAVAVDVAADWVWVGTPRLEDSLQDFKYIRKILDLEESSTHKENKQRTTKTTYNNRISRKE
jgi:predicted DsbA family dithiol-disulfide isomerase